MSVLPHQSAVPGSQPSARRHLSSVLWLAPLVWLWFVLINDLRVEWTVNPQYSYGWAVPFLCVFLVWQRIRTTDDGRRTTDGKNGFQPSAFSIQLLFIFLALLYAPTRLIEEANPGWRLVSWALALEVVGLTLLAAYLAVTARSAECGVRSVPPSSPSAFERFSVSDFVFPVCFFLVAVPWSSHIEIPLIQGLTRADTAFTTELLGWFGIPAMPHGNVIEVATGMVGIDEACSGIRSFQATLMISLFLGEFYRLTVFRRSVLCLAGFALSFLFNLARMSLLVWVAARKGVAAIASWHDPAGVTILVACFFSLWGMGVFLKDRKQKVESRNSSGKAETLKAESGRRTTEGGGTSEKNFSISAFQISAFSTVLTVWILLTEFSVEAWYRSHETRVPAAAQWTVAWPVNNPGFKDLPLAALTRQFLRYDEGRSASWQEDNLTWQAVFLRWKPGRTAIHLAQNHTPEVCMTAAGYTLNAISPQEWIDVKGLRMPFLAYQVMNAPRPFFVFYCLWDDRASAQGFKTMSLTYGNRLAPVLAGLRNPGQRSLEIAVFGPDNAAEAGAALRAELERLVTSKP
jgi:exosortase